MTPHAATKPGLVEWAVASRPMPGETESGDLHLVAPFEDGVLAAAIDGLGHGPEAAKAAGRAADVLSQTPGQSIRNLVEKCHQGLRSSRGAVMTIARFDARNERLTWTAVGNVEAALYRAAAGASREMIVPRAGVVGYQLPRLREATLPLARDDTLVLATDGVSHDLFLSPLPQLSAPDCAASLLNRYAKDSDDALILVVRYLGPAS
jgi:serine phosphatase RsbU (regulator of sigma subunit)